MVAYMVILPLCDRNREASAGRKRVFLEHRHQPKIPFLVEFELNHI